MTQGRAAGVVAESWFTPDDVLYCAMPLFHGNALNANLFPALRAGATIVLRRKFSASGFLPDVRGTASRSSTRSAVRSTTSSRPRRPTTTATTRSSTCWGPRRRPPTCRVPEALRLPVIEGYGSSENAIIFLPARRFPSGSLGRPTRRDRRGGVDPATGEE